jgi:hypothetical protein
MRTTVFFGLGCIAAALVSGCGPSPAREELGTNDSELGAKNDGGSSSEVDPFDSASCAGPAIDAPSARARWAIGATARTLGRYAVTRRVRLRSSTDASGWGPWQATTGLVDQDFGDGTWVRGHGLVGTVVLAISPKGTFYLSLVDDDDRGSGAAGGTAYGRAGAFEAAPYFYLAAQNRATAYKPRVLDLEFSTDSESPLRQAIFSGAMTASCLRLTARHETAGAQEELAIFSPLSTTSTPFVNTVGCYPGGAAVSLTSCGACCAYGRDPGSCSCAVTQD